MANIADISYSERLVYSGFYEGLAYAQAALDDQPLRVNIPGELYSYYIGEPFPFVLADFFTVVADMDDEGAIHYWLLEGDTMLLYCTESHTPANIPDEALWAGRYI